MAEYISKNMLLRAINSNVASEHRSRCVQLLEAILNAPTVDVVPKSEADYWKNQAFHACMNNGCLDPNIIKHLRTEVDFDLLKSSVTHKEEKAYAKGYADAKADLLEKLQADIARDEILAEYGDEFFEGRIAGFKAVINYLNAEDEE